MEVTTLLEKARALLAAEERATQYRERQHALSVEFSHACPPEANCSACWPEVAGLKPVDPSSDIARGLIEAAGLLKASLRGVDNEWERQARAFLAKVGEG